MMRLRSAFWIFLLGSGAVFSVVAAGNDGGEAIPNVYSHLSQPAVMVEDVRQKNQGVEVRLRLINPSKGPLAFFGYSSTSPLYKLQNKENGEWVDHVYGWCGTGLGEQRLPSAASTVFHVFLQDQAAVFRIGVNVHSRRRPQEGDEKTVWTAPIHVPVPDKAE